MKNFIITILILLILSSSLFSRTPSSFRLPFGSRDSSYIMIQPDSLRLILHALNKGLEYKRLYNSSEKNSMQCDSTVQALNQFSTNLLKQLEQKPTVEFKTNWLFTAIISSAVLLINWTIYLLFQKSSNQ